MGNLLVGQSPKLVGLFTAAALFLGGCAEREPPSSAEKANTVVPEGFSSAHDAESFTAPIEIEGDGACVEDTLEALTLLEERAATHLERVETYVGRISCQETQSGMNVWAEVPTFEVGNKTREAGAIWYAGSIVHDAEHAALYQEYASAHPGENIPDDTWTGREAEGVCLDVQADALQQIGASPEMVQYVRETAIDTDYYEVPIEERTW